ncbi:hypothetical protein CEV31_1475 [Brucella thiophenivorans]|uniref:Uncharacterized protein n=1 Tax=Brucella thiophenivorans TaxID=571255 RepID=A0A256FYX9_9HYPH|nr:hypothetical protein CEV31_1475 [Brucella thiophenivorans]
MNAADFCHIITQTASKQLHFFSLNVEIIGHTRRNPLFVGFLP